MKRRLAVCIDWPYTMIPWTYMASLWASDVRREPDVFLIKGGGPVPDIQANAAIQYGLDQGATEFLFVSADQTVPPDILRRFRSLNKDVVGALTATRQPGHAWLTFEFNAQEGFVQKDPTQPVQRMDGIAAGCMLIKRRVFETIPSPWFFTTTDPTGQKLVVTNDFNFFANCRKHGVEVWIDSTTVSEHQYELMLTADSLGRSIPRRDIVR